MLADARTGAFDIVITEALDRLSRDQEDTGAVFKASAFSKVQLITLAEGKTSELHVGLKGAMNAISLKDLSARSVKVVARARSHLYRTAFRVP